MAQRSFRWLLISLALTVVTVDLVSKYAAFRGLYNGSDRGSYDIFPGVFQFYVDFNPKAEMCDCALVKLNGPVPPRVNHGALYGIGNEEGYTRLANRFFLGVSCLAAIAIVWWGTRPSTRTDPLLSGALGLILGGTIGNLFDRIVLGGVRDFLHWYLFQFPVFNFADSCLVCGAGALLVHALFVHPKMETQTAAVVPAVVPETETKPTVLE